MMPNTWIEPFPVIETYADGVAEIQDLGNGNFRAIYFVWVRGPSGIIERQAVWKNVRPKSSALPGGIVEILKTAPSLVPRLVGAH